MKKCWNYAVKSYITMLLIVLVFEQAWSRPPLKRIAEVFFFVWRLSKKAMLFHGGERRR